MVDETTKRSSLEVMEGSTATGTRARSARALPHQQHATAKDSHGLAKLSYGLATDF